MSNLPAGVSQRQIDQFMGCDGPDELDPLFNRQQCVYCKRSFLQDDWTGRFFLEEDCDSMGMGFMRRYPDDSFPMENTKRGWICSPQCEADHTPEVD